MSEEKAKAKPRGWRKAFAFLAVALYGLMAAATYLVSHEGFRLYHEVRAPMPFLAEQSWRFVQLFREFWPVYGVALGGLAVLGLMGLLDKPLKPLTGLALVMCLGTVLMGVYIHLLPQIIVRQLQPKTLLW
jgi:hypothetical protein